MVLDTNQLAQGVNAFGSALFAQLEDEAGADAKFLSPWGIAHALAMLLEGSEPGSASHKQLEEVVFGVLKGGGVGDSSALSLSIKALTDSILEASNSETLTIADANSAWLGKGLQLLPAYQNALSSLFNAQARPLTSAAEVNSWVATATHDKIKTIIDDGAARSAALILVNAIYFKGLWEAPFAKGDTVRLPFYLRDGTAIDAPHMHLAYKRGTALQGAKMTASLLGSKAAGGGGGDTATTVPCVAVKMAYQGGAYSAVLAMPQGNLEEPRPGTPLQLEGGIDYAQALGACRAEVVSRIASNSKSKNSKDAMEWISVGAPEMAAIKIYLPRFEVEFGTSLATALQKAGLTAPFLTGDFTKISSDGGNLMVSDVVHKVYVKADEQGTEAAAATAVMMVRSVMLRPPPELFVKFDRPFVFTVVHEASGLALFSGEVYTPEKWA